MNITKTCHSLSRPMITGQRTPYMEQTVQLSETGEIREFRTLKERNALFTGILEALTLAANFEEIEELKEKHRETLNRFMRDPEVLGLNQFEMIQEAIEERRNEIANYLTR